MRRTHTCSQGFTVPTPLVSHSLWTAAKSSVWDCSNMLQDPGPPIQSWISLCERSKGGGKEASLRSRQHHTKGPVGVAPTQLSLPVTCIHQLLPGSGCHQQSLSTPTTMAWPCPGYPCLTLLSHISHAFFWSHNGSSNEIFYFPWKKLHSLFHGSYSCMSHRLTENNRDE